MTAPADAERLVGAILPFASEAAHTVALNWIANGNPAISIDLQIMIEQAAFTALQRHRATLLDEREAEVAGLRVPSGSAVEQATAMVARWEHGAEEHRKWLRDMCIPEVAAALDHAAQSSREGALGEAVVLLQNPSRELEDAVFQALSNNYENPVGAVLNAAAVHFRSLITKGGTPS